MGNSLNEEPPRRRVALVTPLFDFPPLAARTRMLESSYNLLFGKLALKCLFDDYFEEAGNFSTRIMLKPIDDPLVDFTATVSFPLEHNSEEEIVGNAVFRWQSDEDDPHTFTDVFVSNSDLVLQMRSCVYYPQLGFGAFGVFPLLLKKRLTSEDYGVMGLRFESESLSFGATLIPFTLKDELPKNVWLVSKIGRLSIGAQYEPQYGGKENANYKNSVNWTSSIGYQVGSGSPLSPSFNFVLEAAKDSQFIASFFQRMVFQRQVINPYEKGEVVGITNYIDFGLELLTRGYNFFQVAASWQANKNFLLKGKVGLESSSVALAFKSWWKPSVTVKVSATRDHVVGKTAYGFGIQVENLREASCQRADPNYLRLTPNMTHLAEGIVRKDGKRPMLKSDTTVGNFEDLPRELRPYGKIL